MQLYSCMQQTIARHEKSWQIGLAMSQSLLSLKQNKRKYNYSRRHLQGSKLYLAEDLTIDERSSRNDGRNEKGKTRGQKYGGLLEHSKCTLQTSNFYISPFEISPFEFPPFIFLPSNFPLRNFTFLPLNFPLRNFSHIISHLMKFVIPSVDLIVIQDEVLQL